MRRMILVTFIAGRMLTDHCEVYGQPVQPELLRPEKFEMPARLVRQAKAAAAAAPLVLNRKQTRPGDLKDLDLSTPQKRTVIAEKLCEEILQDGQTTKSGREDIQSKERLAKVVEQLRYLGDDAIPAIVRGMTTESPNWAWFATALENRGIKGLPDLEKAYREFPKRQFPWKEKGRGKLSDYEHARLVSEGQRVLIGVACTLQHPEVVPFLIEEYTSPRHYSDIFPPASLMKLEDFLVDHDDERVRQLKDIVDRKKMPRPPPILWPKNDIADRQLALDALTHAGESYGPDAILRIARHLNSDGFYEGKETLAALLRLDAVEMMPFVLAAAKNENRIQLLVEWPTEPAMDAIVEILGKGAVRERKHLVGVFESRGGRWIVPLLVACLDDSALHEQPGELSLGSAKATESFKTPEDHRAHRALRQYSGRRGHAPTVIKWVIEERRGRFTRRPSQPGTDFAKEIESLKEWWNTSGERFLAGEEVGFPKLTETYVDVQYESGK